MLGIPLELLSSDSTQQQLHPWRVFKVWPTVFPLWFSLVYSRLPLGPLRMALLGLKPDLYFGFIGLLHQEGDLASSLKKNLSVTVTQFETFTCMQLGYYILIEKI